MPIRLNLLAEAQAAELERRRDPVKRAMWLAALAIVLVLVWSSSLQFKAILLQSEVSRLESQINGRNTEYNIVRDNQNRIAEIKRKLDALQRLSANRLLNGTLLNALQLTTVDDVQLLRLRLEQLYSCVEATKARTNEQGVVISAKPASSTERIQLTLEGADCSVNPGDQLNKYKDALGANAYFKESLLKTNGISLRNLAPPQLSALTGKRSVIFTLECRYPEKVR